MPMDDIATNPLCENDVSRERELERQVASLKSSVEKLTRGELKHKEILYKNARDFGKKGLGSFPEPNKVKKLSPDIKASFIKQDGAYCQHCQVTGHHTRECPLPSPNLAYQLLINL